MKAVLAICILFLLTVPSMGTERKYGVMAESDAELLSKTRDPEIGEVILGCVFRYELPTEKAPKSYLSHVTVIEAYKGKLAVGEKIIIEIPGEQGPTAEQELGRLRFYFLAKETTGAGTGPAKSFFCDWTNNLSYEQHGEALRKLLRTQSKSRK